jgi:hypothetical protein
VRWIPGWISLRKEVIKDESNIKAKDGGKDPIFCKKKCQDGGDTEKSGRKSRMLRRPPLWLFLQSLGLLTSKIFI